YPSIALTYKKEQDQSWPPPAAMIDPVFYPNCSLPVLFTSGLIGSVGGGGVMTCGISWGRDCVEPITAPVSSIICGSWRPSTTSLRRNSSAMPPSVALDLV